MSNELVLRALYDVYHILLRSSKTAQQALTFGRTIRAIESVGNPEKKLSGVRGVEEGAKRLAILIDDSEHLEEGDVQRGQVLSWYAQKALYINESDAELLVRDGNIVKALLGRRDVRIDENAKAILEESLWSIAKTRNNDEIIELAVERRLTGQSVLIKKAVDEVENGKVGAVEKKALVNLLAKTTGLTEAALVMVAKNLPQDYGIKIVRDFWERKDLPALARRHLIKFYSSYLQSSRVLAMINEPGVRDDLETLTRIFSLGTEAGTPWCHNHRMDTGPHVLAVIGCMVALTHNPLKEVPEKSSKDRTDQKMKVGYRYLKGKKIEKEVFSQLLADPEKPVRGLGIKLMAWTTKTSSPTPGREWR